MKEIVSALVKAKKEFKPIVKDKRNPFFKSMYADLSAILDAVEPALLNNGLVIMQPTRVMDGSVYLVTQLWHESGECLESEAYPIHEAADPQKLGSAITYARRYQLTAFLGVAAEDDDGNHASGTARKAEVKQTSDTRKKLCAQIQALRNQIGKSREEVLADLGSSSLEDVTDADLVDLIEAYTAQIRSAA